MFKLHSAGILGRLNSRWSFGRRLTLISALFCAPVALLLYLFIQASAAQIGFSSKELEGARYLDKVWPAVARGQPTPAADGRFNEGEALQAFAGGDTPYARASTAVDLIAAVSDGSNLTLDPDLDSYYMMDAVAFRLPAVHKAARELEAAFASGQRDQIVLAAEHLAMAAGQSNASLAAAMKNNAAGLTRSAMQARSDAFATAAADVSRQSQAFLSGGTIERPRLDGLDAELDATWRASNRELSRLLVVRIDGFQRQLVLNLALTAAALLLAGACSFLIARGLSARLGALLAAMGRLSADDTEVAIPCLEDRNETGRIAAALAVFRDGILERNRLQGEAARAHEQNAAKLREVEAAFTDAGRDQAAALTALTRGLAALAQGDLTTRIEAELAADYRQLRDDFNAAAARLQDVLQLIAGKASGVLANSNDIAQASDQLSERTERQAAGLEETAAALEQITATVGRSSTGTQQAAESVAAARAEAQAGSEIMERARQAMAEIEGSSSQIARIIGTIDEIAFQTNLLALNAGVEAARAGDSGRGFAVVAAEVRALAQHSAEAAREIKGLIQASADQVGGGVKLVRETSEALERIVTRVSGMEELLFEVAGSAREQTTAVDEVSTTIHQMDQVTQQNAAMAEHSSAAARGLRTDMAELTSLLSRFRLGAEAGEDRRAA